MVWWIMLGMLIERSAEMQSSRRKTQRKKEGLIEKKLSVRLCDLGDFAVR